MHFVFRQNNGQAWNFLLLGTYDSVTRTECAVDKKSGTKQGLWVCGREQCCWPVGKLRIGPCWQRSGLLLVILVLAATCIWRRQKIAVMCHSDCPNNMCTLGKSVLKLWSTFGSLGTLRYYEEGLQVCWFYCSLFHLWQQYPDHRQTFYSPRLYFVNLPALEIMPD